MNKIQIKKYLGIYKAKDGEIVIPFQFRILIFFLAIMNITLLLIIGIKSIGLIFTILLTVINIIIILKILDNLYKPIK